MNAKTIGMMTTALMLAAAAPAAAQGETLPVFFGATVRFGS